MALASEVPDGSRPGKNQAFLWTKARGGRSEEAMGMARPYAQAIEEKTQEREDENAKFYRRALLSSLAALVLLGLVLLLFASIFGKPGKSGAARQDDGVRRVLRGTQHGARCIAKTDVPKVVAYAAVRCCSMDGTSCASKVSGTCFPKHATAREAVAACAAKGMRLCRESELRMGLCCGTGCKYDLSDNWFAEEGSAALAGMTKPRARRGVALQGLLQVQADVHEPLENELDTTTYLQASTTPTPFGGALQVPGCNCMPQTGKGVCEDECCCFLKPAAQAALHDRRYSDGDEFAAAWLQTPRDAGSTPYTGPLEASVRRSSLLSGAASRFQALMPDLMSPAGSLVQRGADQGS